MSREEKFYGRRRGRALRVRKSALMQEMLPHVALLEAQEGVPYNLPENPAHLWLEIGFGGGEHLVTQALQNPHVTFLGAEAFENGVASLLQHMDDAKISNIWVYPYDVRPLLRSLPEACLEKVFILFPDPWRKKRHYERRMVQTMTLQWLYRLLKQEGELVIASDHAGYQEWILEHCDHFDGFQKILQTTTRPEGWPTTRYEAKALEASRQPLYLTYKKVARPLPNL